jgi:hypothetical protein
MFLCLLVVQVLCGYKLDSAFAYELDSSQIGSYVHYKMETLPNHPVLARLKKRWSDHSVISNFLTQLDPLISLTEPFLIKENESLFEYMDQNFFSDIIQSLSEYLKTNYPR